MDPLIKAGVALITGAGSGIGQSIAIKFAQAGCSKLFLVDVSEANLQKTKKLLTSMGTHTEVVLHSADISNESAVKAMVDACVQTFGRLDFACNNAGIAMSNVRTTDVDVELLDRIFNVNMKGVYLCHKYEIAAMLRQQPLPEALSSRTNPCRGSIVNTASLSGIAVVPELGPYSASKTGVVAITRVDARQFAAEGLRINCVCPGFVDTPLMRNSNLSDEFLDGAKRQAPMNRFTESSEIADGVVFLSGSSATAITGISLPIDGGALLFHVI